MLKDKELTSLHDSLFAKFKNYALSKEQMRQVRGGSPLYKYDCTVTFTDGRTISGLVEAGGAAEASNLAYDFYMDYQNQLREIHGEAAGIQGVNCNPA